MLVCSHRRYVRVSFLSPVTGMSDQNFQKAHHDTQVDHTFEGACQVKKTARDRGLLVLRLGSTRAKSSTLSGAFRVDSLRMMVSKSLKAKDLTEFLLIK